MIVHSEIKTAQLVYVEASGLSTRIIIDLSRNIFNVKCRKLLILFETHVMSTSDLMKYFIFFRVF